MERNSKTGIASSVSDQLTLTLGAKSTSSVGSFSKGPRLLVFYCTWRLTADKGSMTMSIPSTRRSRTHRKLGKLPGKVWSWIVTIRQS
jgi:hypothetical protein